MLKKLITIILQIFRCFQNPPPTSGLFPQKLVDYLTDKTILTTVWENILRTWRKCHWVARSKFQCQSYLLYGTWCWYHRGTGEEGTTRSWNAQVQGGRWILPCLFHWGAGAAFKEDRRAGQQVRFQFEQQCALEKTQGKDSELLREQEMIKMPALSELSSQRYS